MMKILSLFLLVGCARTASTEMPVRVMPDRAIVLREALQGPGKDRTGNWRGWFDSRGCWWEEHNTWLVVTDPLMLDSSDPNLHWNAAPASRPWFCLNGAQLAQLQQAVERVPSSKGEVSYRSAVDRWTVRTADGDIKTTVIARNSRGAKWAPMLDLFEQLAAMSVWGQSPEP